MRSRDCASFRAASKPSARTKFIFAPTFSKAASIPLCRLSAGAFEKVSNREGCDGLIGVVKQWSCGLEELELSGAENPTVLVADSIEKSGNLGALLRSADALCAEAVILTNSVCDIFNPAVVRASQGALFSVKVAEATPAEAAEWLKARGIKTFGAHLGASDFLWNADMSVPCAIVVGSEKDGLGDDWNGLLDCRVKIPMGGISDSMNVNVAAALFLYEAMRSKSAL